MTFNSWEFLVLLALTFALYYPPWSSGRRGKAWQVSLLLVASAVFYGWQDARLLALLAVSCVGNSVATTRIIRYKVAGDEQKVRKWVGAAVILNLGLLAIFKYAGFVAGCMPFLSSTWVLWMKSIPLPIGISFYTFHGISMIVDVSRGEVTREGDELVSHGQRFARGTRDIAFYLLFFPQLVAGPIIKAKQFWPQIGGKCLHDIKWRLVVRSLITGYFLKIVVADNLAEQTALLTDRTANLADAGSLILMPLLYSYSLQIFSDFAGYSLIAIGLAALFGYKFPENFNFPYLSVNITEFWRRWHMSLSAWLRDYLYIPLGGNRKGPARTYGNLFLVMFLGGLWHGAEWKFALWGSLHGLFLALERFSDGSKFWILNFKYWMKETSDGSVDHSSPFKIKNPTFKIATSIVKWAFTFHIVTALWLTFLMPDMASIFAFFNGIASGNKMFSGPPVFSLVFYGSAVALYHAWGWLKEHREHLANKLARSPLEPILHGVMLFLILTNPGAPRGFIYFQF